MMSAAKSHLRALGEIERTGVPGLVEVLRQEGIDAVRYALWDAIGWHRDYGPPGTTGSPESIRVRAGRWR